MNVQEIFEKALSINGGWNGISPHHVKFLRDEFNKILKANDELKQQIKCDCERYDRGDN